MSQPDLRQGFDDHVRRRVARLLLRHDRTTFHGKFREIYRDTPLARHPLLHAYDRFIRAIALADELGGILHQIRMQLSSMTARTWLDEEPPARGQIDWGRSLGRAWDSLPDQPPLRFITRLDERHNATPENIMVVAILQAYGAELAAIRRDPLLNDAADSLSDREKQEIATIEDTLRRELGSIHLQELVPFAEEVDLEQLIEDVERRLPPGRSPYRDLIEWWRRVRSVQLRAGSALKRPAGLYDDSENEALLFQLWIALELADFLDGQGRLNQEQSRIKTRRLELRFCWQAPGEPGAREFRLTYDRQPTRHLAWRGAPGERPDYFIERAEPHSVEHGGALIWHEPGVLLDAKYYFGDEASRASSPIKRMIADMQLVDATRGVLVLPTVDQLKATRLSVNPERYTAAVDPTASIELIAMPPDFDRAEVFTRLLDWVAGWLPERPAIACHGMLQDRDTLNPDRQPPQRCPRCNAIMALCPKPHIGPGRVDLVCPRCDCLHNARLCHILPQAGAGAIVPFVRRVLTLKELNTAISTLRANLNRSFSDQDDSAAAEAARTQLLEAIGSLTEEYMKLRQPNTKQIEEKLSWIFKPNWDSAKSPRGLPEDVRNMLISGEFVRLELENAGIEDWAAAAVQYVRAIEREFIRRLYDRCGSPSRLLGGNLRPIQPEGFTFGTVTHAYKNRGPRQNGHHNWQTFLQSAVFPSGATEAQFTALMGDAPALRDYRNQIAHSESINQASAVFVATRTLGDPNDSHVEGFLTRFIAMLDSA